MDIMWRVNGDDAHYAAIAEQIGITIEALRQMGENMANAVVVYDNSSLRNRRLIGE